MLALIAAVALLVPFTGLAQAGNGGSGDTAAGPHAYGRFLIGNETGPLGWVTFDVRPATALSDLGDGPTDPGTFRFDALPGVTDLPATTRSAAGWVNFYYEERCGNPDLDVAVIFGVECLYYTDPVPANDCRDFVAGFYDAGPGTRHDFFRWGPTGETMTEYWIGGGSLAVNLGP